MAQTSTTKCNLCNTTNGTLRDDGKPEVDLLDEEELVKTKSVVNYIKNRNNSVGVYIANCRRNPLQLYFEVEIVALGRNSIIGVGLVHDKYPLDRLPGWKSGSIGFHADDGSIFIETGYGDPYGPVWNVGDMIGCGIHLPSETNSPKKSSKVDFFFTYNGKKVRIYMLMF
ncbi:SPRY domain-containing protein 3-like [Mytilus californianus]|uniref:SPRY domain-containing protein 3-like n=1 Tax=Mytilus californianus TaxID=6549 RepID=UPI0022453224|nr:SPRY domain-containing protein 3-like [Mytilus californianus]